MPDAAPVLAALRIAADPDRWRAFGLTLDDAGRADVGGVVLEICPGAAGEEGVRGWAWRGLPAAATLDGIDVLGSMPAAGTTAHALGVTAVDHVVVATGDFERTVAAFDAAGLDRRRVRSAGAMRQAFYVAGPALVEVAAPAEADGAPAHLWGVTFVVADIDAAAARLGDQLGEVRDAVQPGRRIATASRGAGLGVPVALMTPRS
jgi:hypothetical protein